MGSNLVFEVIWNPEPIAVEEKIASKQSLIFEMPLGALVSGNGGGAVESVNGKTGEVVLNHLDVDADVFGSAAAVSAQLQIVEDDLNQQLDSLLIDLNNLTQEVGTKANATAVTQALSLKADLVDGKIPASQLPEHVSDITEYSSSSAFPVTGESGRLYVDITTNISYRWSGSIYIPTGDGGVVIGTTAQTAHRGDHGVIAYNHALSQGNPHNTTTSEIIEGTNKYFTDLRVRNTVLSGLVKTNSSNVTNTDTVEIAVGKLAAKSEAGGSGGTITWVDISTLNAYYKHRNISTVNTKIEVAKIGGMLWVRGYVTTTNSIAVDTEIFSFADNNYRWDNTFYTTFDYNLILAKTSMYELGVSYSLIAAQVSSGTYHKFALRAGQNYSNVITHALIQPVCVGKHY